MLAPKLLISGVGIIGLAAATAHMTGFFQESNVSNQEDLKSKYFIGTISETQNTNLPDKLISGDNKNYDCIIENTKTILKKCKIIKTKGITNNKQDWKISSAIKDDKNLLSSKNDILDNEKVIIEIDKANIEKSTKITVVEKNSNSKSYFSIVINDEISNDKSVKTNLVLAKVTSSTFNSTSSIDSLECKLGNIDANVDCKIYSFENSISDTDTTIPFISSDLASIKGIQSGSDLVENKWVLLKVEEMILEDDWSEKTLEVFMKHDDSNELIKQKVTLEYKKPIINVSNDEILRSPSYKYLVVSSSANDSGVTSATNNSFATSTTNSYKCSFIKNSDSSNLLDEKCELYDINKLSSDEKTIDLHKLTTDPNSLRKIENPVASKQYILKIDFEKYSQIKTDNKLINLISKSEPTKHFVRLTEVYELNKQANKFKTNLILAKVKVKKDVQNEASSPAISCKLNSTDQNSRSCKVFKFSADSGTESALTINGSNNLTKITNKSSAPEANKFVLIQVDNFKTEKELRSYAPEIYITTNESGQSAATTLLTTEYVNSYVGKITESSSSFTGSILRVHKSPQDYLVVVAEQITSGNQQATSELFESDIRKYKCKTGDSSNPKVDDNCELIAITTSGSNSVNLNNIKNSNDLEKAKSNLTVNKYFKLKISSENFMSKDFGESDLITIASNKDGEDSKSYAKVKVVSKFFYERNEGKTDWFLAKSNASVTDSAIINSFKCKNFDDSSFETCAIYKTSANLSDSQTKEWNLTGFTKTTNKVDLNLNKYVLVKLNSKKSISTFSNKTIEITKQDGTSAITTLNIQAPLSVILNAENIVDKPVVLA